MAARLRLTAPCLLAALALAACSGAGPGANADLTWEDSPLNKVLDGFYGGIDEDPEEYERVEAERQRQVEEIVASCMAEEGFEYTPVAYDAGTSVTYEEVDDTETAEWAQQYGYGITTDPWSVEEPVDPMEPEEEWSDPNWDYVESMSQSEQDAYYAALYGAGSISEEVDEGGEWIEEEEPEEYSWEDEGCQGRAYHEVYDDEPGQEVWEDPAFTEFFAAAERLYEDALNDPRMTEMNAEWAACMADAGVTGMIAPDEAANTLHEEYEKLYMEADALVDWESIDWDKVSPYFDPVREAMDGAGLSELREREIATAVADHACQEDLDLESRYLAVQFEHEEEFVKTYQAEIDALVATYGQGA